MYGTRNTVVGLKDKSKISMCLVLGVKLFLVFNDQNWTGQKKKKELDRPGMSVLNVSLLLYLHTHA